MAGFPDSVLFLITKCSVEYDGSPQTEMCAQRGGEHLHPNGAWWPLTRDERAGERRKSIDSLGSIRYDQPGRRVSDGKFPHFTEQWISS
jgi:hypothetical protein